MTLLRPPPSRLPYQRIDEGQMAVTVDFKYSDGVLSLRTFNGSFPRTLANLFRALMSTSLVTKLDLLLDLELNYKELKLLKDTMFNIRRLRRLRLDFPNQGGPTTDILNRGKRGDVLAEILTSDTLHVISFCRVEWFFIRSSTFSILDTIHLSEIHLESNFEPNSHPQKLKNPLHRCSKLEFLESGAPMLILATPWI
ncbi:hypothetical protein BGX24_010786 [Mortierella sp. AD032]|nr:hypothetical protein BGX24_010786 [Mortierella sp. AD032]